MRDATLSPSHGLRLGSCGSEMRFDDERKRRCFRWLWHPSSQRKQANSLQTC